MNTQKPSERLSIGGDILFMLIKIVDEQHEELLRLSALVEGK